MRTDTPMEALADARQRAFQANVLDRHIITAAFWYAYQHPEWFASWPHCMFATEGFADAAQRALDAGDKVASLTLHAVAELAHPENDDARLFGGPR